MRYLSVTETTEGIDYSEAKQMRATLFIFRFLFLQYLNMHGCFSYFRENYLLINNDNM